MRRTAMLRALGIVALTPLTIAAQESTPSPGAVPPVAVEEPLPGRGGPPAIEGSPAPRFLIETIVVEGGRRGSQKIVAAETLLTPGSSYTELQLREGLQRVARLPFVVEADFALRKGTERGRFELVISVTEARPVFVGGAADIVLRQGVCCGRESWTSDGHGPGLGGRLFFAGQSELSAGLGGFGHSSTEGTFVLFNVAYTHHNLFGKHVAGTVAFGPEVRGTNAGAQLAFPLNRASVLTLAVDRISRRFPGIPDLAPSSRLTSWRGGLSWQWDTTDDPFTPRSGSRVGAGFSYADSDFSDTLEGSPDASDYTTVGVPATGHERVVSGSLQASRYWPLPRRLSFGLEAGLSGSFAAADGAITLDGVSQAVKPHDRGIAGSLGARLTGTFPERRAGLTQFWWTLRATFSDRARWRTCDPPVACEVLPRLADLASVRDSETLYDGWGDVRSRHGTLSASISARGRWGVVSLTFHYRHYFVDRLEWSGDHPGWR